MDTGRRDAILSRLEQHYRRFERDARTIEARVGPETTASPVPLVDDQPLALSPREVGVLELVAEGLTDREIAAKLQIGDQTVKSHVRRTMVKLRARNRTHAVISALRLGYLELDARAA